MTTPVLDQRQTLKFEFEGAVKGLDVVGFSAHEAINAPFEIHIQLSAFNGTKVDLHALMDAPAALGIFHKYDAPRWLHGVVAEAGRGETGEHRTFYDVVLRPTLHRLDHGSDCRIWQGKSVPEIAAEVLGAYGVPDVEWRLAGSHAPREYCVQYRETHRAFLERILAEEGIYYFFAHDRDAHKLILTDAPASAPPLPGAPVLTCNATAGGSDLSVFFVRRFSQRERLRATAYAMKDYTFKNPAYGQDHSSEAREINGLKGSYDLYDYPGRYKTPDVGGPFTRHRMDSVRVDATLGQGMTNSIRLSPGYRLALTDHANPAVAGEHLLLSVSHSGSFPSSLQEEAGEGATTYSCGFVSMPARLPYRPPLARKPVVDGPQIATVVGPAGEEIYCDEHGRVKIQFPWDRYAQADEHSSCWVRVAQFWGGAGWGHIALPRIGHEVIISFLEGDPDQPIITGRAYHAANRTPYPLPEMKTVMAIKSRTHKGDGYNELRFEDQAGVEQVFLHAQKDQDLIILNDRREHVFHDRHKTVEQDQYEITKRDHHTIIGKDRIEEVQNSSYLGIARDYVVKIGQNLKRLVLGGETYRVMGSRTREVMGSEGVDVKLSRSVTVGKEMLHKGPNLVYEATKALTIKGPGGFIKIDDGGVTIVGKKVKINEGGTAGVAEPVPPSQPDPPEKPRVADVAIDGHPGRISNSKPPPKGKAPSLAAIAPSSPPAAAPSEGRSASSGTAKSSGVKTGLGEKIDKLVNQSPKLAQELKALKKKGWSVKKGEAGGGSFADREMKVITVDPNDLTDTATAVQTLAHEVGHARYVMPPAISQSDLSKDQYVARNVARHLRDEGEATMFNAEVRDEILKATAGKNKSGIDIGVAGHGEDHLKVYKKYKAGDLDRDKAIDMMANIFGEKEKTSTTKEKYNEYYGNYYKDQYQGGENEISK